MTDEWCQSIEPFSRTPPPQFLGALLTPPPPQSENPACPDTYTWVCERHGNLPCPTCALMHRGVRHCCSKGHSRHPKGVCVPCPGGRGHASTQATCGSDPPPPGGLSARNRPTHPTAPEPHSPRQRGTRDEATRGAPPPGTNHRHRERERSPQSERPERERERPAEQGLETNRHCGRVVGAS